MEMITTVPLYKFKEYDKLRSIMQPFSKRWSKNICISYSKERSERKISESYKGRRNSNCEGVLVGIKNYTPAVMVDVKNQLKKMCAAHIIIIIDYRLVLLKVFAQ